ncbi:hypothetical protein L0V05_01525 [Tabrizicola sp. J26]|nr:hypothetical protein [Tabrizicola rongguiensis]
MRFAVFLLFVLAAPARAQSLPEIMQGLYGSATDPATACEVNPHEMNFLASPPHLFLSWNQPRTTASGASESGRRYDLLAMDAGSFTLRREGETERTASGDRPIWILRRTTEPEGYCWGGADWPLVRCEDQQLRCSAPVS